MLPDIDFSRIRTLKNSKNKGFEELAVQLFRSTFPKGTRFYRVDDAGGDGGVEDIALQNDGTKIGIQAKYFETLGGDQWTQINRSARKALKDHLPDLLEYRITCPLNRKKNSKSWDNYCEKWNRYAKELGYASEVEFVWEGETELRLDLQKPEHQDKVYYWFGCKQFTPNWLQRNFAATRKLLDTRYSPVLHIDTDSQKQIEAFFHSKRFQESFWRKVRAVISNTQESLTAVTDKKFKNKVGLVRKAFLELRKDLSEDVGIPPPPDCSRIIESFSDSVSKLYGMVLDAREKQGRKKTRPKSSSYSPSPFSYELYSLNRLQNSIDELLGFVKSYNRFDCNKCLLLGVVGTGKSHLIASAVDKALDGMQPVLFLVGEQFSSNIEPLAQITQILNWGEGVDSLLGALDAAASICGRPAIIAIDAINESGDRKIWKSHLPNFARTIEDYKNIRLLVSCRSDFSQILLPRDLDERRDREWTYLTHMGFGEDIFDAVSRYFSSYNVRAEHFPPLLEEFSNPLFLKTFCETYENAAIPKGALSFDTVMKKRLDQCAARIHEDIDCPKHKVGEALKLLAKKIIERKGVPVPYEDYREAVDQLFPNQGDSKSLYTHLRSNGMVVETASLSSSPDEDREILVRFPYERFSDYFLASQFLDGFDSLEDLKTDWKEKSLPGVWIEDDLSRFQFRGLLKMMAILIPERFNCEFLELFPGDKVPGELAWDFLSSLPWRTLDSLTATTERCFLACGRNFDSERFLEERLSLATIPGHPLNGERLHADLSKMKPWERELNWTITITRLSRWSEEGRVNGILRWAFAVPLNMISDEQFWPTALFLAWLLTSNDRFLRHRATLALIRILSGKAGLAGDLIDEFHDCNDPYVVERIYAVACGVALRETNSKSLRRLSKVVYRRMFAGETVPPHILQRDYASVIVEYAHDRNALATEVNLDRCRPPYQSKWPRIISEADAQKAEKHEGWSTIGHSIAPEATGWYGDFGRYVMEFAIHHFSKRTLVQNPSLEKSRDEVFSGYVARRYILQRIRAMGWTPERFQNYERQINHWRMRPDEEDSKVERISKKLQWIGLHELLGYLSDRYRMTHEYWSNVDPVFEGAWQIYVRDFDPTQPYIDPQRRIEMKADKDIECEGEKSWWFHYADPFQNLALRLDRERWVLASPVEFDSLIQNIDTDRNEWLTLSAHYTWVEQLTTSQDETNDGILKMWADIRCWLIEQDLVDQFLKEINKIRFWGKGCEYRNLRDQWIGEYPWAPSVQGFVMNFGGQEDWLERIEIKAVQSFCGYHDGRSETFARIPSPPVMSLLRLYWSRKGFDYVDPCGRTLATCPVSDRKQVQQSPLLALQDDFLEKVREAGYCPIWGVLSERSCYSYEAHEPIVMKWGVTQRAYRYEEDRITKCHEKRYEIPLYK